MTSCRNGGIAIRRWRPSDSEAALCLFRASVHTACADDYTPAQRAAWAPDGLDAGAWCAPFTRDETLVAEESGRMLGFANMDANGHLDRLYVHPDCQRRGIATALLDRLEAFARSSGLSAVTADASITARPFFAARGYALVRENSVLRRGVFLKNYSVRKALA